MVNFNTTNSSTNPANTERDTTRVNQQINSSTVRLIDAEGEMVGVCLRTRVERPAKRLYEENSALYRVVRASTEIPGNCTSFCLICASIVDFKPLNELFLVFWRCLVVLKEFYSPLCLLSFSYHYLFECLSSSPTRFSAEVFVL